MANIRTLSEGMLVECKKPHPCGQNIFRILRVGSLCRVVCLGCNRDMNMDRVKLERAIRRILPQEATKEEKTHL